MGLFKSNKQSSSQSHIIYTDNVRRKSVFSIKVSDIANKENDIKEIAKHIETFEEKVDSINDGESFITASHGNFIVVTEVGANFVLEETLNADDRDKNIVSKTRKWLALASAFLVLMINMGLVFTFGTLFPTIREKFGDNRASTAAIQSVFLGMGSSGIVFGVVVERFGSRNCGVLAGIFVSVGLFLSVFATSTVYLQLSYGVVSALAFTVLHICANQTLSKLFKGQSRIVCLAVIALAPGIGGVMYPYLLQWLTEIFGLSGTFLLLGGVMLNAVPLALLWSTPRRLKRVKQSYKIAKETINEPEEKDRQNVLLKDKENQKNFLKYIWNTLNYKPFLFLFLGLGFIISTINIFSILMMDIFASNGLSVDNSVTAVTVYTAASIPSRLTPGFTNKIKGWDAILTPILASVFGAFGMSLLLFVRSFAGNMAAATIIGVSRGIYIGSMSVVTLKVLDSPRFSIGFGLIFGITNLFTIILGPVYGFIRDLSGSYTIPLCSTIVSLVVGFLLCIISLFLDSRVKAQQKRDKSMSVFTVTRF